MVFCSQNSDFSARIASLYGSQSSSVVLCIHNSDIMTRINSLYGSQTSPVVLCMQNSRISTRITSLQGSQTSPVVLCMQNKVISIRNTSLYGHQPLSVVFACKTATFGSELQNSMYPRLRLLICECKTACLDLLSIGHSLNLWFCAFKRGTLTIDFLVSMGPSPHFWLLHAKQCL